MLVLVSTENSSSAETLPDTVMLRITDATLISAELPAPTKGKDVLIHDGRIAGIVDSGDHYPALQVIDGQGGFLIPGLIDSHVHLAHNPYLNPRDREENENLLTAYREQLPRSFLYYGITSVVDLDYDPDRNGWLALLLRQKCTIAGGASEWPAVIRGGDGFSKR